MSICIFFIVYLTFLENKQFRKSHRNDSWAENNQSIQISNKLILNNNQNDDLYTFRKKNEQTALIKQSKTEFGIQK